MKHHEHIPPGLAVRRADTEKQPSVLTVELVGDWVDGVHLPDISVIRNELAGANATALEFEARQLGRWGSALIVAILALHDLCAKASVEFRTQNLPTTLAKLIALARAVPDKADAAREKVKPTFLERIGESSVAAWAGGRAMFSFLGETLVSLVKLIRGRAQFRGRDLVEVVGACGPQALGIVALINFLVGLILAFVGATQLARFGASIYTADLVAVATVREMGCIMTGIILCGRTGAAFAAQLGTMKVNQEIDAFQTFGISPFEFLALPRMLALVLMMPLLVLFADFISIAGGFLVSTLSVGLSPQVYLQRTVASITLSAFLLGLFKGSFFGVIIALTGCLRGMQCGSNAAAVGLATTSAVVTGITCIIASDGVFAVICSALQI